MRIQNRPVRPRRMRTLRAVLAGALLALLITPVTPRSASAAVSLSAMGLMTPCQDVVFIGARGSGQSQDATDNRAMGAQVNSLLNTYASGVTGRRVGYYSVIYPAQAVDLLLAGDPGQYFAGLDQGVRDAADLLRARYRICANERYVLAGYSQGAMVMHRVASRLSLYGVAANRIDGIALIADGDRTLVRTEKGVGTSSVGLGVTWQMVGVSQLITSQDAFLTPLATTGTYAIAGKTYSLCDYGDVVCNADVAFKSLAGMVAGATTHTHHYTGTTALGNIARTFAATAMAIPAHPPMAITSGSLPVARTGISYATTLTASGGVAPYAWTRLSGALPSGLTLNSSGAISGTPTTTGVSTFKVKAVDHRGQTLQATFALTSGYAYNVGQGSAAASAWAAAYNSGLGNPVSAVHPWGPGCIQDFRGGTLGNAALMQRSCTGPVYQVTGAHWTRVAAIGAATIGYPINNSHRYGASWTQDFTGGTWGWNLLMIPDVDNTHAFVVRSGMREQYIRDGGASGKWGVALSDETPYFGGAVVKQRFTGGTIVWQRYSVGQGAATSTVWAAAYNSGLGYPVSAVHPWGPGCIQDFRGGTLGNAALMQRSCTGPVYQVTGAHWTRVAAIGAATIGYPINNSHRYGASWTQDFTGGTWGWNLLMIPDVDNTHAFVVRSGMREQYIRDGGAGGRWGVPTSDEYAVPVGARENFTGGTMTWRAYSDTLSEGQTLGTNGKLMSMDERFTLIPQGDGNLVLYGPAGALWATNTAGAASPHLVMQGDSNLVLYDASGAARWASGNSTFKGAHLVVQNDGNLVVYDRAGAAIWSRYTGRINSVPSGRIAIRSTLTGRYWTSEIGLAGNWWGAVRAQRTSVGGWELYELAGDCRSAAGCAIKSLANGKYISAELAYTGDGDRMLRARADTAPVGGWERFQIVGDCDSNGGCAIKSLANGRFASADYWFTDPNYYQYGLVRARATGVSGWETFRIYQW